ncbi:hypothetical protein O3M35_010989 [Rhynocoris fuscipes]|uniref:Protein takeout n=1 Tax=Rhynocoris fuscipes TaxID=488301 RepID=A0AAW1D2H4_9HEMI
MNECLKGAIENAIHELGDGNPSLGVLPMDPFHFDAITINQGTGPVSIKLDYSDLDVTGLKNIKVNVVRNDWQQMDIETVIPTQLVLEGKYRIDGKVLVLPISGTGHCKIIFDNYKAKSHLKFKEFEKNGKQYYELSAFDFDFDADNVHIQFDNLFNGDKALGDNMNAFLNENWREILQELKPAISRAFGAAFREVGNRVFSKVPINDISPK